LSDVPGIQEVSQRESRARERIRVLSEIPERFAGTRSERQAADRLGEWMRQLGVPHVSVVPVPAKPRAGLVLALHTGLGALGCLWGGFIGAVLAILAAWSSRRELRRERPLLSRLFETDDSVNVVGRVGPDAPSRRVVLSAHIDTAQAGWIFSREVADRFAARARRRSGDGPPVGPGAVPEALLIAGAIIALGSWLGAHGVFFGLLRVTAGVVLLAICAATLQWAGAPGTPGANDNASAVAAMLDCGENLLARLPADVELWLVGTGAEEVGCCGMHGFAARHLDWPAQTTYFVNFECVGGGALHFIRSEGVLDKTTYPPRLIELARRVAEGGQFGDVTPTDLLAGTDGHVPAKHGYPTLSLISLQANGVPLNYHRPEDVVDAVDLRTVIRAADFATAVINAALRGEADPITSNGPPGQTQPAGHAT
jgi:hypothetical protein